LACVEPADPGYDKRIYICATCGYEDFITVRIERALRPSQGIEAKSDLRWPLDDDQPRDGCQVAPRRQNE
jgi:hypothetical protein